MTEPTTITGVGTGGTIGHAGGDIVATMVVTHLSETGQVTIPDDVRAELRLDPGQPVQVMMHEGGVLIRPIEIDPEQAWFWTPEWQAKEREADEDIAAGRTTVHYSTEEFLAALSERAGRADT